MELLNNWINGVNDILWSYILIIMLLGCAVWFTIKSRFVQFRMIGEMIRLLGDSAGKGETMGVKLEKIGADLEKARKKLAEILDERGETP